MLLGLFEAFDSLTSENNPFPLLPFHSIPVVFLLPGWLLLLYRLLFLCLLLECWQCQRSAPGLLLFSLFTLPHLSTALAPVVIYMLIFFKSLSL